MRWFSCLFLLLLGACSQQEPFDIVLDGGDVHGGQDMLPINFTPESNSTLKWFKVFHPHAEELAI